MTVRPRIRFPNFYTVKHQRPAGEKRKKVDLMQQRKPTPPAIDELIVRSTKDGWSLMVDDLDTPAWTVGLKKQAVEAALDTAKELGTVLTIESGSGAVQDRRDFSDVSA